MTVLAVCKLGFHHPPELFNRLQFGMVGRCSQDVAALVPSQLVDSLLRSRCRVSTQRIESRFQQPSVVGDVMGPQLALQRGLFVVRLRKRVLSQEVVIGRIIEDDQ